MFGGLIPRSLDFSVRVLLYKRVLLVKNIYTKDLKPGLVFSFPVFTIGNNMLVPRLVPLRQKDINMLVDLEIDVVTTEGEIIDPEKIAEETEEVKEVYEAEKVDEAYETSKADEVDEAYEADEIDSAVEPLEGTEINTTPVKLNFSISEVIKNTGPYRAYKNLIEKSSSIFTGIKFGTDVQMDAIYDITDQLLQDLRDYTNSFIDFILGGEVSGHELAKSSVNTAILSALTAYGLNLDNHKVHNVVAGALLHDVGMLRLSKGITEKKGGLSEAELEQIKSHPLHTSKIVTKELFGNKEVNLIALQHHERWDGKGYPDHLSGPSIDIGARIVSVADAFEAMVSKKSYRGSILGYQAIKNLMADNERRFDPAVISAFIKIIGIYPIGSILRLNNNSVARVIRVNTEAPMRPVIQMLMDENGKVLDSKNTLIINLLEVKTLFIKSVIDPAEFNDSNE